MSPSLWTAMVAGRSNVAYRELKVIVVAQKQSSAL